MGGDSFLVTTFPGLQMLGLDSLEPRTPTRKEFHDGVKVLDALENLHFISQYTTYFGFEGVPQAMRLPESFAARARNSSKLLRTATTNDTETLCINMAKAVGSDVFVTISPSPPLTYSTNTVESIYRAVLADLSISIVNGDIIGVTGPATIAGSSLTGNAEILGGLVLAQLIKRRAKVTVTNFVFPQNMRLGMPVFAAVACALSNAIFCQYFRKFGIPAWIASTGPTSSKIIDFQCGQEKAVNSILAAVCGANLIFFVGGIFGGLTFHPVEAILDNGIAGRIGRFIEDVTINDETMAIDLIEKVGPIPGHFLAEEHTRKWWKLESFVPEVADRLTYPEWLATGKKTCIDYAREKMEKYWQHISQYL